MRFEVDCVKLHHRLISEGQKSTKELNRLVRCQFLLSMEHKQGRNKMNTKQTDNIQELTCNICSSSSLSSIFIKFWSSGMEKTSHWNKTHYITCIVKTFSHKVDPIPNTINWVNRELSPTDVGEIYLTEALWKLSAQPYNITYLTSLDHAHQKQTF